MLHEENLLSPSIRFMWSVAKILAIAAGGAIFLGALLLIPYLVGELRPLAGW